MGRRKAKKNVSIAGFTGGQIWLIGGLTTAGMGWVGYRLYEQSRLTRLLQESQTVLKLQKAVSEHGLEHYPGAAWVVDPRGMGPKAREVVTMTNLMGAEEGLAQILRTMPKVKVLSAEGEVVEPSSGTSIGAEVSEAVDRVTTSAQQKAADLWKTWGPGSWFGYGPEAKNNPAMHEVHQCKPNVTFNPNMSWEECFVR